MEARVKLHELDLYEVRLLARSHRDAVYAARRYAMRRHPDWPRSGAFAERLKIAEDGRTLFAVYLYDADDGPGRYF